MMPWVYVPFKTGCWGDIEIVDLGDGYFEQRLNGEMIMHNGPQDIGLHQELELFDDAHGRVLIGGLGFGLSPLLVAMKPNVTEVVVVELYRDVIDSFLAQGYSNPKVTIVQDDIFSYVDNKPFDFGMADIYALPEEQLYPIFENNNIKDFRWIWWRPHYLEWLAKNKYGVHNVDNFHEFCDMHRFIPKFDRQTVDKYFFMEGPNRTQAEKSMVKGLQLIKDSRESV